MPLLLGELAVLVSVEPVVDVAADLSRLRFQLQSLGLRVQSLSGLPRSKETAPPWTLQ